MRRLAACLLVLAALPATAATTGRAIVAQAENADMGRAAHSAEFALTQALAYPVDWVGSAYYQVALFGPEVDLAAAAGAGNPEQWVEAKVREPGTRAVVVTIEPDGGAQNMKIYADGKSDLGAGGTMGTVYGLARKSDRLSGHYVYLGDLFGSAVAIDASFDEKLWTAPKGQPMAADGGAAGAAYLDQLDAIRKGDEARIRAGRPAETLANRDSAAFKEVLPMLQQIIPDEAKVVAAESFPGGRATLKVEGKQDGKPYHARVAMIERDGRWLVESSDSGTLAEGPPAPPALESPPADVLPLLTKPGVYGSPVTLLEQPFTAKHGIAVRRPGSDEFVPQVLVLLSETPLAGAKDANALWAEDVALDKLFGKSSTRSMLFLFNEQEDGSLAPAKGFEISAAGEFNEAFSLRADVQRFGPRLVGQYVANRTNPDTGENTTEGAVRFDLTIVEAAD